MNTDILIIGAGPAGLSFARDMAETGLTITIVEKQPESVLANPPYDGREIALTHLSHKIMSELGIWNLIPAAKIGLIKNAKVLNGTSPAALSFKASETGEQTLGFMVSNDQIRKAAYKSVKGHKNIHLMTGEEVTALETNPSAATATLSNKTKITAQLVVAADSRFSNTRRMMGIPVSMLDFGRTCIVTTMQASKPHHETAYECFHFDRTLAVLPLPENRVSIVITLDTSEKDTVLKMTKAEFETDIQERTNGQFGKMKHDNELYSYPLVATFAKTFHAPRFALVGDAAVGMHPVTAHGFNLGLRGARTLATELKKSLWCGEDLGTSQALARYSTTHARTCTPLYHGTNALVKLYTNTTPLARIARQALLGLGNNLPPVKRLITAQLTEKHAA